jgi:hypothetical protein
MSEESSAQKLCLSCGLCCDGSLFVRMPLHPGEEIGFLPVSNDPSTEEIDGRLTFILPCHHHKNLRCDIYQSVRPEICGQFQCKLLQKYIHDKISYSNALEIIRATIELRDQVRAQLMETVGDKKVGLARLYRAWTELQNEPDPTSTLFSPQTLKYVELQLMFNRHFREKGLQEINFNLPLDDSTDEL